MNCAHCGSRLIEIGSGEYLRYQKCCAGRAYWYRGAFYADFAKLAHNFKAVKPK